MRQDDVEIVGVPWTGAAGVQRTTDDIMNAQADAPAVVREPRLVPEHEIPGRRTRPQDPNAPLVASTSGDINASTDAPVRTRTGFAPQPVTIAPPVEGQPEPPAEPSAPQTITSNFDTVTGPTETGAFPPDTMGAIGPSQFVLFINGRLRTFNKTTGAADGVVNVDPDVFFASVMTPAPAPLNINFTSDPQVRYDRLSGRWIMIIIDVPSANDIGDTANRILIAVSDAASVGVISGSTVWTFYFVQQDTVGGIPSTGEFLDYPSLGVDANALYIGGDMFDAALGSFSNTSVWVIRKSSILSGGPVVTTAFRDLIGTDGPFEPRGVDNYDPAATEGYFIGASAAAFGRLIMRRISTPATTPTISANISITVPTTSFPRSVDHLGDSGGTGTAGNLDALDDRLMAAHIRNGRLWTAHAISVTSAGVGSGTDAQRRDAVRWYELVVPPSVGTPTVNQSGTIFDPAATRAAAREYFIPSVMVSGQGHAALGYSTAGTPYRADAATNGRLVGDTLGTTGAVNIYTTSTSAYNPPGDPGSPRRWGDYSFTSLDPLDDMTMWTVQQYCNGTGTYGERVARLAAPPPATPTSAAPLTVPANVPSTNVVITGTSVSGSGFYDPGANLAPPALPFNHITATVPGVIVNTVTYNNPTQVTLNISTVGSTPGPKNVTITNPDGQSMTGTATVTVTPAAAPAATAGQVLISEFRFRGSAGATDEFTELYNNTDTALDISGYTIQSVTAGLVHTVPGALGSSTTVIPARGHYLVTGAGYSLGAVAASNGTQSGIGDASSIGFFAGTPATAANRIDSVGFNNTNPIYFEGTPLTPATGTTTNGEYSFLRRLESGTPQDTNDNNADFVFVSTTGGTFSTRVSILGAPGPENLTSPTAKSSGQGGQIQSTLIDPAVAESSAPNRVRTQRASCPSCDNTKSNLGTLAIRRKFTNNTGAAVTRLRFRIVDITTLNNRLATQADLRALNATGNFLVTTTGGNVTVESLTLEAPSDAVTNGGGLNSTLGAGTITVGTPLANGASINVNFLLGVQLGGGFRFFVTVEALP
ncbi:MAG TPA: lamin tail domain-containing protein [Pyrinomonadaceae bacterium]|jgi:hypothetical protein